MPNSSSELIFVKIRAESSVFLAKIRAKSRQNVSFCEFVVFLWLVYVQCVILRFEITKIRAISPKCPDIHTVNGITRGSTHHFLSRCMRKVWVQSHLSASYLRQKKFWPLFLATIFHLNFWTQFFTSIFDLNFWPQFLTSIFDLNFWPQFLASIFGLSWQWVFQSSETELLFSELQSRIKCGVSS